jgi:hypothetical protein
LNWRKGVFAAELTARYCYRTQESNLTLISESVLRPKRKKKGVLSHRCAVASTQGREAVINKLIIEEEHERKVGIKPIYIKKEVSFGPPSSIRRFRGIETRRSLDG